MTLSSGTILVVAILDILLLLGSFITYRRILRMQEEFERIDKRNEKRANPGGP